MNNSRERYYKDLTVGGLLAALGSDYANKEALIYVDRGLRYTFREFELIVRKVAKGLISIGIEKGGRVALWATNVPEWIILQFALAKIGAILVTLNTSLRSQELEYLLKQSESAILFCIQGFKNIDYVNTIYELVPQLKALPACMSSNPPRLKSDKLPFLRHCILIGDNHPVGFLRFHELANIGAVLSDQELARRESTLDLDEVINMQYTSGTTGFPKGVMLSHRNIVNNAYWLAEGLGYTSKDKLCLPVPLFHCFGCVIGVLGAFTHAACLVPLEYFDPHKVLEYVEKERCTALYGVPTMFIAELEDPELSKFDLSSLRTGVMAGALCPAPLMRRVMNEMNLQELTIAYGLTESSPGITQTLRNDTLERRTQTVGKVMPELEVRVIDPITLKILPVNVPGELCVRGYNVMKGYYNNDEATREAIISLEGRPGWLRTGDQATIGEEGYVRITGRIKEIIIRGGENVAPKEIEDLLRTHPKVADVYVYGISSPKYGEEIAAAIRLKPDTCGKPCTSNEIIEFCSDRIAKFKIPQHIRFVEDFPMTASGKVQRFKLREMHESEIMGP